MRKSKLAEYCVKVLTDEIVACKKIKKICLILLSKIEGTTKDGFHFDLEAAYKHIDFIEKFMFLPSGTSNTPFILEDFQKARFEAVFGFVDDNGIRQYNEVLIIEGRKNGKTSECAAVEIDLLVNDNEFSPQIYNLATKREQAMLGFNAAYKMIMTSPLLSKHIKKRAADLYFGHNMGFIKAMASNTQSLDGLDVHGAVIDELAAITKRDLYDLIKQATGSRKQPLIFTISTNGFVRDNIYDAQYQYASDILDGKIKNNRFLPFIYELDDVSEWTNEETWIKANPGLGTVKSYEYMRQIVQKGIDDPAFKPTVMVKEFNMPETNAAAWLRWNELNNENTFNLEDFKGSYFIGGFDGAEYDDLACATALLMKKDSDEIYVHQHYWTSREKYEERVKTGRIPYEIWKDKGLLTVCEGNRINFEVALKWFEDLRDIYDIFPYMGGFDKWHFTQDLEEKYVDSFGKDCFKAVRQGTITLSSPMKDLKLQLQDKNINYNNNPILKWNLANTEIKIDVNGNIQPIKKVHENKIDGLVSLLIAYVVLFNNKDDFKSYLK